MDLNQDYTYDVESRLKAVIWVVAVFFAIVVVRLVFLQIIRGEYYRLFSENNSIKEVVIAAPRGIIYDRNGEVIADNRGVYDVIVIPQYVTDRTLLVKALGEYLNMPEENIWNIIKSSANQAPYKPVVIKPDVSLEEVSRIRSRKSPFASTKKYNLDGVDIQLRYERDYSNGLVASHVLGYIREIDSERLKKLGEEHPNEYKKGDYVGIGGIEESFDLLIKGKEGFEEKVVNALGREVGASVELSHMDEARGDDVYLTIDRRLQNIAREALGLKSGAVVAIEPETGAVLAMYSSPSYDLNQMQSAKRNSYWAGLVTDEAHPLYNRAIQGTYPPASTYKIVTAVAALEEGVVKNGEKISCHGGLKFGNRVFGCWLSGGHGQIGIVDAIIESCDTFFYTMGIRLGVDRLAKYAKLLGLGSKTGLEIRRENGGLIPTGEWKKKRFGTEWMEGETLSAAIGQGYNLATPLQVAMLGAEIANGGYRISPYLVERVKNPDGDVLYEHIAKKEKIEGISGRTIDIIKEGLVGVVNSDRGTARRLKLLGLKIAGKTGTAQVIGREKDSGSLKHETHAWFVGYAPFDEPKIAVAAIVEHGGHGSGAAAPVVAEVIETYFSEQADKKVKLAGGM